MGSLCMPPIVKQCSSRPGWLPCHCCDEASSNSVDAVLTTDKKTCLWSVPLFCAVLLFTVQGRTMAMNMSLLAFACLLLAGDYTIKVEPSVLSSVL
jgi:hypothetical protein